MTDNDSAVAKDQQLVRQDEVALQKKYLHALVKANPGLGDKSAQIAECLVDTGLTYGEATTLIKMVYAPSSLEGRGQATRLSHFYKAVQSRYGESRLERCSRNVALFKGFLAQMSNAIEMRDNVNAYLDNKTSLSFHNALLLEDLGLPPESFIEYVNRLVTEYNLSETAAVVRICKAAKQVEKKIFANLEAIIFPEDASELEVTDALDTSHKLREE